MKDELKKIGKKAVYHAEAGFEFNITIEDVRSVFGRIDYQIKPVSGYGLKWVSADRVKDI